MQDKNGKYCGIGTKVRIVGYVSGQDEGVIVDDYGSTANIRLINGNYDCTFSTFQLIKIEDEAAVREVGIRYSTPVSCGDIEYGEALVACECGLTRAFEKPHAWIRPPTLEGDAKHLEAARQSEQLAIVSKIEFQKRFETADNERIRLQNQKEEQGKTITRLNAENEKLLHEMTTKPRSLLADKTGFAERNAAQLTVHLNDAQTTIADHESTIRSLRRTIETWKERAKKLGWKS